MATRSKLKDPGLMLTVVMVMYAALVFVWWPVDTYFKGISLVGWLMFIGLFIWLLLGVIYVLWIEKLEEE
ncbi:hypothetical protein [Tenuibacillus multivorans]|uniref:Uncharacterized protein n=1 Tax=Tenuibacillus multivorans TaxID=237069 RepID=A0A1H0AJD2_9BACI|nr:hypothetical protein [Tenuibacillus multivorans]GEL78175.1 hypothetical protein TMU01_24100 [Tenuibacillus multivorans]SDN33688.1 hypothetical protein SAMN05216498_1967 [Tenuibacillus multivorans]